MSSFSFMCDQNTVTDIATQGNGLIDFSVRFTSAPRTAMWILNRNANPALADNIKYVAAIGGGLWIRNMTLGSAGANFQNTWYVNFNTGNNNADGLTLSTPVKSINEVQARWGDQVIDGYLVPFVEIFVAGNTDESFRLTPKFSNHAVVIIYGTRTNIIGLNGTFTTFQNWNGATKTQCEFSYSSLATSWTAAGAVGNFLAIPSLGDVSVIVGKDLGSKTALSCGPCDVTNFFPVDASTIAFQGYTVNKISANTLYIAPEGLGVLIFKDIELGNNVDLHCIEVFGSAQTTFSGCRIFGLDNYAPVSTGAVGSMLVGWRNYGIDLLLCNVHDSVGGAILRVHETGFTDILSNILMLGVPSIDLGGVLLIEEDASTFGAFQGFIVNGKMQINGSFWAKNANASGNVLQVTAGAFVTYADATKIGATGSVPTSLYRLPGPLVSNTLPFVATSSLSGIVKVI